MDRRYVGRITTEPQQRMFTQRQLMIILFYYFMKITLTWNDRISSL